MNTNEMNRNRFFDTDKMSTDTYRLSAQVRYSRLCESIKNYIDSQTENNCTDDNTQIFITLEAKYIDNEFVKQYEIEFITGNQAEVSTLYDMYTMSDELSLSANRLMLTAEEQKQMDEYLIRSTMSGVKELMKTI